MLAFSTFGHPPGERSHRIKEAVKILEKRRVDFEYDGDMAADVARNPAPHAAYPFCRLSGPANVLIMPAFHSASISTKLLQELGGATVIGPMLVGLDRPVQIVPLGARDSDSSSTWRRSRRSTSADEQQVAIKTGRRHRGAAAGGNSEYAASLGARRPGRTMAVRHRTVRHRLRPRARAGGIAVRPSVRRPVECASRGAAAVPEHRRSAGRGRIEPGAMSCASISTTPRRMWWTPTTKPGANSSRAGSRRRRRTSIGALPARGSRWRCRSWRPCRAPNFQVRHEAGAGAYNIHASSGYSPALSAGDFRFVPGQTAEALDGRGPADRSRGAPRTRLVEGHADQARNGLHHQAQADADARGRERRPRHGRESTGLSARSGGRSRLPRGLGEAFSGRARDNDHRNRDARLHHAGVAHRD